VEKQPPKKPEELIPPKKPAKDTKSSDTKSGKKSERPEKISQDSKPLPKPVGKTEKKPQEAKPVQKTC